MRRLEFLRIIRKIRFRKSDVILIIFKFFIELGQNFEIKLINFVKTKSKYNQIISYKKAIVHLNYSNARFDKEEDSSQKTVEIK